MNSKLSRRELTRLQREKNSNSVEIQEMSILSASCSLFSPQRCIILGTGGPSSSYEIIILHNNSHGGIIKVCMRIFTTAVRNKTIRQILNENTSPYFHSVSLVIQPFTLMKSTHFSELSISRFSTYIRKAQSSPCVWR